ncbi:formyltransferase family protein [Salinarimonas chemoclinalis]|uniref:formyltransferase family protein n=1 Tax=Salinarimonas chemoclinalis TaxID=3241599 RepID=UPI00355603CA
MIKIPRAPDPILNHDKVLLSVCTMDWCDFGVAFSKRVFTDMDVLLWDPGDPYPTMIDDWEGDWIISYRGDFIFPERVYSRARKGAINFHPAPPRYRGLGSQHYAIYAGDKTYGSTCHHLARSVDTGDIIDVEEFDVAPGSTASTLRIHVGAACLQQYLRLLTRYILPGNPLPRSERRWGDRLYRQAEIDAWLAHMRETEPNHLCLL